MHGRDQRGGRRMRRQEAVRDRQAGQQRHAERHRRPSRLVHHREDQRDHQHEADVVVQRQADHEAGDGHGDRNPGRAEPVDQADGDAPRGAAVGDQLAEHGADADHHHQ